MIRAKEKEKERKRNDTKVYKHAVKQTNTEHTPSKLLSAIIILVEHYYLITRWNEMVQ